MARRRGRTKKSKQKSVDMQFITLVIISVLLGIIIYFETGSISNIISPKISGIFGAVKGIIPVFMFLLALVGAINEKKYYTLRVTCFIAIILLISGLLSTYQISKGLIDIKESTNDNIKLGYDLGVTGTGGGAIGTIIALLFVRLLGMPGTSILSGVSLFFLFVLAYGGSPTLYIKEKYEKHKENKEERRKQKELDREKRLKEEKLREKEKKQEEKRNDLMEGQIRINLDGEVFEIDKKGESEKPSVSLMEKVFGKKDKHDNVKKVENKRKEHLPEDDKFREELVEKEQKTKSVLEQEHVETFDDTDDYTPPSISLLKKGKPVSVANSKKMVAETATKIQKTLYSFGVSAKVDDVSVGPAVTRYELIPAEGVRVNKIANLSDDLALNLAAESLRIEAPIPGKRAVGIEVPNTYREVVSFRDIVESDAFTDNKSKIAFALGKATNGEHIMADISKMPHVLIAGATGSGKSVCINTIICSIIYRAKPTEVKMMMIDPKVVELSSYNGIPHLIVPVVTEPKNASAALQWAVDEMVKRFRLFAETKSKNLDSYNEKQEKKMPQIVVIVDELADLMMVSPKEVEDSICRIAQMGRAAGIHLIIATQRPSVDVITGLIKANMPTRIAFAVSSGVDSRTILDQGGAEKLLGKGDMLYYPIGASKPHRVQGAFISEEEINKVVNAVKTTKKSEATEKIQQAIKERANKKLNEENEKQEKTSKRDDDEPDEILYDVIDLFVKEQTASSSLISRRFRVGNNRAGRLIDQIEDMGIISSADGNKARNVLISVQEWEEMKERMQTANPVEETEE